MKSKSAKSKARKKTGKKKPPQTSAAPATEKAGSFAARLPDFLELMRFNRPIGTLLLLWPTLWALWLAADGMPPWHLLVIFVLGVILMRAAGCVINDFADRKVDGNVERTKGRPMVTGRVSKQEAIGLFVGLCLAALVLVLFTNTTTILMSFIAVALAFCYPFVKRHSHLPQVVLGAAFSWSIPMAFTAQGQPLGENVWLLYTTTLLWVVAYDTFYAMVDRDDDMRIGVKSTAILFGSNDRMITGALQLMVMLGLFLVGQRFELGFWFQLSLLVCAGLFVYQQWMIQDRVKAACFRAFLNNNWVGMAVFIGLLLEFSLRDAPQAL